MPIKFFIFIFITMSVTSSQAFKVGLVLDKGGKDDKSFNSSAFIGASKAKNDLGIDLKYVEATDNNAIENLHRSFANKKFDLIIGVGFAQVDAIKKIAPQFKNTRFVIIDGEVPAENVKSILFEEHQGSYLVGVIAALKSTSKKVGFIGGMDIPLIRRFELGYQTGVKAADPKAQFSSQYIGVTGESWNNPAKAKQLALAQYNSGVDVIFVAAGASNSGVFDAAEEKRKLAIGVDSNQNHLKPGFILTSMLKRVDIAVYNAISEAYKNQFKAGVVRYGLKEKGIDFAVDENNNKILTGEIIQKTNRFKDDIISGKIKVPDYYLIKK